VKEIASALESRHAAGGPGDKAEAHVSEEELGVTATQQAK
jgi:hypothetical protein